MPFVLRLACVFGGVELSRNDVEPVALLKVSRGSFRDKRSDLINLSELLRADMRHSFAPILLKSLSFFPF